MRLQLKCNLYYFLLKLYLFYIDVTLLETLKLLLFFIVICVPFV